MALGGLPLAMKGVMGVEWETQEVKQGAGVREEATREETRVPEGLWLLSDGAETHSAVR